MKLRGLPFSAGAEEVATFLAGLDLIEYVKYFVCFICGMLNNTCI